MPLNGSAFETSAGKALSSILHLVIASEWLITITISEDDYTTVLPIDEPGKVTR
jgi:hypothetical protein